MAPLTEDRVELLIANKLASYEEGNDRRHRETQQKLEDLAKENRKQFEVLFAGQNKAAGGIMASSKLLGAMMLIVMAVIALLALIVQKSSHAGLMVDEPNVVAALNQSTADVYIP